jgi:hypothetical protein
MSEFQQYQFQSIDRPLTQEERNEVSSWSSRTSASTTSATFNYSYGDFPKNEKKVVANFFDAMLYVANWGTKRLMFRFPKNIIEEDAIKAYAIDPDFSEGSIDFYDSGAFLILDITFSDDSGEGWIDEDEYQLGDFIPLREQIINGDYRCLMLAWAKIVQSELEIEVDEIDEEYYEEKGLPPIPAGLNQLNAPLTAFQDFFGIYEDDMEIILAKSPSLKKKNIDYKKRLATLSAKEKDDFLLRLLNGEKRLDLQLKRMLERGK